MSFQQGLSGLNATSRQLEVIGNNIANVNTYGSKASRAEFADMYAAALAGGGSGVTAGIGVTVAAISQQFTQGNITTTDNPMDVAINGGGFFQIRDGSGAMSYTRNGQFKIDRDGNIVTNGGGRLLGYPADAQGVIQPGTPTALQLPTAGIEPAATTRITMGVNLDSRQGATLPAGTPQIDFRDPTTFNNATSMVAYDAKGQEVTLTYYYQKTGNDQWNVYVTANGTSVNGSNAAPLPVTALQFLADGSAPIVPAAPVTFDIPSTTNAQGAQTEPIVGVSLPVSGLTQVGAAFGVTDLSQDGYAPGQLVSVGIESNGVLMARYSNGQGKPAGQVQIATFRNPQGLQPLGGNGWARTFGSGDPVTGTPGEGSLGVLQAGALEESNIDVTAELVQMITAQRVYQANAQTIKAQDQVLQTMVNMR
jgi:flagellar hook protein FlgE